MKKNIKLNSEVSIDIESLIQSGMVILANSGGGKSYAIRRIAEQAVENIQVIILDPEGEFASLREKYDFILAGKNADVPVEVRSSAMLAIKLLEIGKSAIIDLYELHPQERQRYVKLFCEAIVNCPKELYHPVLIILDEAHEYVPEGKPSEATWAVESLASKGRKRGQRLILASQRIAKISKNVTAEANNKLIGRASQDIDMKRAGDELGFNKEKLVQLRQLKPGEFFAFGPSISEDVIKVKIGDVKTAHAKVGYKGSQKAPSPSSVIKKVLGELKDLPQEAEKEAKTAADLKTEIKRLKSELTKIPKAGLEIKIVEKPVLKDGQIIRLEKVFKQMIVEAERHGKAMAMLWETFNGIGESVAKALEAIRNDKKTYAYGHSQEFRVVNNTPRPLKISMPSVKKIEEKPIGEFNESKTYSKCARAILSYLHSVYPESRSKAQLWIATGYAPGGGFNNCLYELTGTGLVEKTASGFQATESEGTTDLVDEPFDSSITKWDSKVSLCARKILALLLEDPDRALTKNELAEQTGYATGGGFNNCVYELSGPEIIKKSGDGYKINPEILAL